MNQLTKNTFPIDLELLSIKQVCAATGLSRTTLWRRLRSPCDDFPRPIQISNGRRGFRAEEIRKWIQSRVPISYVSHSGEVAIPNTQVT